MRVFFRLAGLHALWSTPVMPTVTPLAFEDEPLGDVSAPAGPVRLIRGLGSGLARRSGEPRGRFWAVGDRGPNVSVATAERAWGCAHLREYGARDGAKVMPRLDVGPALGELHLEGDSVRLVQVRPLTTPTGKFLSGLPTPGGSHAVAEPALDLDGRELAPDPDGADTEGVVALRDGGFWIGDEYGPSLLRVDDEGRVLARWVPAGSEALFAGSEVPVVGALPALAARRRLNRGFEALSLSPDERRFHLAFQSPLAHPDKRAHERGRHVRLWTLDAETGALLAQHLYPLDPPDQFRRDQENGPVAWADLKVSEMLCLGENRLLLLERGSATTRLYAVTLAPELQLGPEHLDPETRPTVEELSGAGAELPALTKTLVLDTDAHPEVSPDLEGMILLSPRELLLVNDNDFGVEGVGTRFWRVTLDADLA
jgi:hypothetical protein